jgi:preprotein translocase subunit SecG
MSFLIGTLSLLMLAISLFMILLVLIQRGRGGGLAGAFGGMGGQSAFGTRAGDTFTRITIVLAVIGFCLLADLA